MPKSKMGPHLIERDGVKLCSECMMAFTPNSKPSLSKAFAEHIRTTHKPEVKISGQSTAILKKTEPKQS